MAEINYDARLIDDSAITIDSDRKSVEPDNNNFFASDEIRNTLSAIENNEIRDSHLNIDMSKITIEGLRKCDYFTALANANPELAISQAKRAAEYMNEEALLKQSGLKEEHIKKMQWASLRSHHKERIQNDRINSNEQNQAPSHNKEVVELQLQQVNHQAESAKPEADIVLSMKTEDTFVNIKDDAVSRVMRDESLTQDFNAPNQQKLVNTTPSEHLDVKSQAYLYAQQLDETSTNTKSDISQKASGMDSLSDIMLEKDEDTLVNLTSPEETQTSDSLMQAAVKQNENNINSPDIDQPIDIEDGLTIETEDYVLIDQHSEEIEFNASQDVNLFQEESLSDLIVNNEYIDSTEALSKENNDVYIELDQAHQSSSNLIT